MALDSSYQDVALTVARKARDAAKLKKSDELDPLQVHKIEKLKATRTGDDTFKAVALDWYSKQAPPVEHKPCRTLLTTIRA